MATLVDTATLRITHDEGQTLSDTVVVAFTGIGFGIGGIQREEFRASLTGVATAGQAPLHSVCYVLDKTRSWYNQTHAAILQTLLPVLRGRRVITLGNSMGGFGALLFGQLLPDCRAIIAFSPQFSLHPAIMPGERRWREWVAPITDWSYPTCVTAAPLPCPAFAFFGTTDLNDAAHAARFAALQDPRLHLYRIDRCGHTVAAYLRDIAAMQPMLDDILNNAGTATTVARIVTAAVSRAEQADR